MDPTQNPNHPPQRFLVPGAPTGRFELGYSSEAILAMREEPECLDERDWDRHVGKPARQAKTALEIAHERETRLLSQEERIREAMAHAKQHRRDVSREKWMLDRMLQKQRKPDVIEKRVQVLERMAYLGRAA